MYLVYNILLIIYWIGLIPVIIYRLTFEQGFYERTKQSAGFMPEALMKKIEGRRAIWLHAASVGEIVATSPIAKEIKREFPEAVVIVSVVTATGHDMAERIIPEADGIIYFPLDLTFLTRRILRIVKPITILIVETEIWPNFLHIAQEEKIPVMMVNGRISDRSMRRYLFVKGFMKDMLQSIQIFCMQSAGDAKYIKLLGAPEDRIRVTGNTKYDQTYATVTPTERQELLNEFGFGHNHPIIVAGSTHRGEEDAIFTAFKEVLKEAPGARLLIAPREIMRGGEVKNLSEGYGLRAICRSVMKEPVHEEIPVVVLDTIGELGRLYSLGDIIFVGGSLVRTGGHNILEPAAHGKPIIVGPNMFNFKEIYALLSSRHACLMVQDTKDLTRTILKLCHDKALRQEMSDNCLRLMAENKGATKRNLVEVRKLFKANHIIP